MRKKLQHIITGWLRKWRIIETSESGKKLSELRMGICGRCDFSKVSSVLTILDGKAEIEKQIYCTKCNCPCFPKSLVVNESCPIKKW